jgi:hypothetical protein
MTITYPTTNSGFSMSLDDDDNFAPVIVCMPGACKNTKFVCADPGGEARSGEDCISSLFCVSDDLAATFGGPDAYEALFAGGNGDDDDDDDGKKACEDVTVDQDTVLFCAGLSVDEAEEDFDLAWDGSQCDVSCGSNHLSTGCVESATFTCPVGDGEGTIDDLESGRLLGEVDEERSCADVCSNIEDGPYIDYMYEGLYGGNKFGFIDEDEYFCSQNFFQTCIPEAVCTADLYNPLGAGDDDDDDDDAGEDALVKAVDKTLAARGNAFVADHRIVDDRKDHMYRQVRKQAMQLWASIKEKTRARK